MTTEQIDILVSSIILISLTIVLGLTKGEWWGWEDEE